MVRGTTGVSLRGPGRERTEDVNAHFALALRYSHPNYHPVGAAIASLTTLAIITEKKHGNWKRLPVVDTRYSAADYSALGPFLALRALFR
jgi:hypothetical protein